MASLSSDKNRGPQNSRGIALFGAGGHAKVVAELARLGGFCIETILVDYLSPDSQNAFGVPIITWAQFLEARDQLSWTDVALAVGKNDARQEIAARLSQHGLSLLTLIHPAAVVAETAQIGDGTAVMPLAVVNSAAVVGRGVIINSGAVVEHDCRLGDFTHLSPNATLGGGVELGDGVHVGLGACILPSLKIGAWACVGAGAVVLADVPEGVTVAGVPARTIGRNHHP